ncbi:hypothetical protein FHR23_001266 [Stakelama sediminis]|uniref:Peptidase S8/S53 domain-containing protein n=1 Tax=Stakelama sediminis TaxID=463200 RepID=A0A840YXV0_9SPHN|nr:hypothetical protein [Stakelama sediminis]
MSSTPTPPSTPTPTPVPTPTPTTAPLVPCNDCDTQEYRDSVGPVSMNALAAYQAGATGKSITAGIVDTGIDAGTDQFPGRIASGSKNVAGGTTTDDEDGHGTAVAFTLAGMRNGVGSQGVAFDATLFIARADTPGSCADTSSDSSDDSCSFSDSSIAAGIDAARQGGAKVINLSLGGSAPDSQLLQAINRATQAGIIIVIAAGNDGDDPSKASNPDAFAANPANNSAVSRGLIIIAGSVNSQDRISDFSNRAGTSAAYYLAAVGEDVRAPCDDTSVCLWSGTSFAAPQISGAVALLAQAFPNLTGQQIVDLLFSTARDAGATGRDSIYGNGILDLTEAFQPQGTQTVAGTSTPISTSVNGTLSAPMGDAGTGQLGTVILDGYSRAFAIDLARTLNHTGPGRTLAGLLTGGQRNLSVSTPDIGIAVTIAEGPQGAQPERMTLPFSEAQQARTLAASVTARLGDRSTFAFASSETGGALAARLSGQSQPAFLVARDPTRSTGFDADIDGAAAVRRQFGRWGLTAAMESGAVLVRGTLPYASTRTPWDRYGYARMTLAADRRFGPLSARLAYTRLDEANTVLGAHFDGALGAARASTNFVDAGARLWLGNGWSLGASTRQGWTGAVLRSGISGGGIIHTTGYAADIGRESWFVRGDRLGLRVSQPLRVATGGLNLNMPSHWDYASESVDGWSVQRLNLAPTGREVVTELSYFLPLAGATLSTNLFRRSNPGNFATLPDDLGAAIRFNTAF